MKGFDGPWVSGSAWLACLLGISVLQIRSDIAGRRGPAALWAHLGARPALRARIRRFLHLRTRFGAGLASACLLAEFLRAHRPWSPPELGPALVVSLELMLSGALLRIAALGVIQKRERLAATGVYSLCRHPLYVGTILIVFGACALIPQPLFPAAALAYFLAFYPLTIAKEEFQNAERFGAAFEAYRASTPLVLPLGRWEAAAGFDWRRALWKGGGGALACILLALAAAAVLRLWWKA